MKSPASVVELLQALIAIPSVNPDGNPGVDASKTGEEACARAVGAFLEAAGATVHYQPVFPGRPNVIGVFPSDRPGKPRVILAPHTDTVSVLGMTIDPFGGEVRDGKVWGRGASDTKGSMAAMLWALWEKRDELAALDHEIWFVGLMGEEGEQHGSRAFVAEYCRENPKETFALIGEPTGDTIVHVHKGTCRLHLTTRGVAVHSAQPEKGENAIVKMTDVLRHFHYEVAPKFINADAANPILGAPTFSIGTIQGGSRTNIVPDRCDASIDIRTTPELYANANNNRTSLADELVAELRKIDPDLECVSREAKPLWTDPDHPLIAALQRCGKQPGGAPWFCDAALFSAAGVPAVAAGPGQISEAHTKDEWIALEALEAGVTFYRNFLNQL